MVYAANIPILLEVTVTHWRVICQCGSATPVWQCHNDLRKKLFVIQLQIYRIVYQKRLTLLHQLILLKTDLISIGIIRTGTCE